MRHLPIGSWPFPRPPDPGRLERYGVVFYARWIASRWGNNAQRAWLEISAAASSNRRSPSDRMGHTPALVAAFVLDESEESVEVDRLRQDWDFSGWQFPP